MNEKEAFDELEYREVSKEYSFWFVKDGEDVEFIMSVDGLEEAEVNHLKKQAQEFYAKIDDWIEKAKDFAVSELLTLKNENWLDENENEIKETEFKTRMSLTCVYFSEDEEFEFTFDDGDLFWGHEIVLDGNIEEGFMDADIVG
ncbi:MAG: DUF2262 domain-containing protein [Promethearchaeota archaeon]